MDITFFNGKFIPRDEVKISPDDRGFLFADGIYEVVRWYEGFFFDIESHVSRLQRSLGELRINRSIADEFAYVATELIKQNDLTDQPAMVYFQVTRGVARRSHSFPSPEVTPTAYAFAWGFKPDIESKKTGIKVMLKEDIRWTRCDIKSVSLLANTMSFQEACSYGLQECIFVRNGYITEGSHSNIFFVIDGTLYTHPESNHILSGVSRKNVLRLAHEAGINIREEPVPENRIRFISEAFITNTSSEVTPVIDLGGHALNNCVPGPLTILLQKKFDTEIRGEKGI